MSKKKGNIRILVNAVNSMKENLDLLWSKQASTCGPGQRYTVFIGGDSAAHNALIALNDNKSPYEVPVVKEYCINHVSKRLGYGS